ncbi:MAG: LPS translocon maturation chaperone LptM [Marinobacter sp.]|uniref:LPS translocon maturation chaperone LptM n=1 Tax=Marinobacter sp. TaxID=50741 RepID=UPI003F985BFF
MRAWTLPMVILVVAAALDGCGQKGPLYRENPEPSSAPVEEAASAGMQNERPDDSDSNAG